MLRFGSEVLLATNHLASFAGSEIIVLEVAEFLDRRGCNVTLFTNYLSEQLAREPILQRIRVADSPPDILDFEFAWIQHQLFPLLNGAGPAAFDKLPPIAFAHLSPFEPMETPFVELENATAAAVLANSGETTAALRDLGITPELIKLFPNPAPLKFRRQPQRSGSSLSRILIVTNHPVPEVLEAAEMLSVELGAEYQLVGVGGSAVRITPELLLESDCVITIGKTVQYCLQAGVPVFCYDHFGGPGWLTESSFDLAAYHNFSGRCTGNRRSAAVLFRELVEGYAVAQQTVSSLHTRIGTLEEWFDDLEPLLQGRRGRLCAERPWREYRQIAALVARESAGRFKALDGNRRLEEMLSAKDAEIIALRQWQEEHESASREYTQSLRETLDAKDANLAALTAAVTALRDAHAQREQELKRLDATLHSRTDELASERARVAEREVQLRSQESVLAARNEELISVKQVLAARDEELESLRPALIAREQELTSVKDRLTTRDAELNSIRKHLKGSPTTEPGQP